MQRSCPAASTTPLSLSGRHPFNLGRKRIGPGHSSRWAGIHMINTEYDQSPVLTQCRRTNDLSYVRLVKLTRRRVNAPKPNRAFRADLGVSPQTYRRREPIDGAIVLPARAGGTADGTISERERTSSARIYGPARTSGVTASPRSLVEHLRRRNSAPKDSATTAS